MEWREKGMEGMSKQFVTDCLDVLRRAAASHNRNDITCRRCDYFTLSASEGCQLRQGHPFPAPPPPAAAAASAPSPDASALNGGSTTTSWGDPSYGAAGGMASGTAAPTLRYSDTVLLSCFKYEYDFRRAGLYGSTLVLAPASAAPRRTMYCLADYQVRSSVIKVWERVGVPKEIR